MNNPITLYTRIKRFRFINEFDSSDNSYCNIIITVIEHVYNDGDTYYEINYEYEYNGLNSSKTTICPEVTITGVTILKNKMTEIMVEYLLADSKELSKMSGASTHQYYRTNIISSLNKMWD